MGEIHGADGIPVEGAKILGRRLIDAAVLMCCIYHECCIWVLGKHMERIFHSESGSYDCTSMMTILEVLEQPRSVAYVCFWQL